MTKKGNLDERMAILNKTLGDIEKKEGKGSVMLMGDAPIQEIEAISTGSYLLNDALGIGGIPKGRIIEIFGPESSGKCLTGDTNILTTNGYRTIYELFEEQESLGTKGFIDYKSRLSEPTEIPVRYPLINKDGNVEYTTHFTINGYKDVYKIETSLGRSIKATKNHPLLVRRNNKNVWAKASELKIGDKLVARNENASKALTTNYNKVLYLEEELFAKILTGNEENLEEYNDLLFYSKYINFVNKVMDIRLFDELYSELLEEEYNRLTSKGPESRRVLLLLILKELSKKEDLKQKDLCKDTCSAISLSEILEKELFLKLLEEDIASKVIYNKIILDLRSYDIPVKVNNGYAEIFKLRFFRNNINKFEIITGPNSIASGYITLLMLMLGLNEDNDYSSEESIDVIVNIEKIEEVPTFDFAMEETHTFIAEGIINHNTTLALHAIAEIQKEDGIAAMIDAEHALDPVYARALGVDVDKLVLSQPDTGEQGLEVAESLARSGVVDLIVVDSVAALVPKAEIEGEMGDSHMGLQARLMSQALRKIAGVVSKTNTTVIFINQIREKIGVMFGCFQYNTRVRLADGTTEKIGKIVNNKMDVEVMSYNPNTGKIEPKKVVNWFNNGIADEFLRFKVDAEDGNSEFLVTRNHLIATDHGYEHAEDLKVGDTVSSKHGNEIKNYKIISIEDNVIVDQMDKFDIEVEGNHNYFVDDVMVHNSPETTTGGRALKFYASVRMDIRRIGQIKDGTDVIGNETRVKIIKNKVAPPFTQAEFKIIYGEGIDSISEIIDLAIDKDIIEKAGSWLTFKTLSGEEIKLQGQSNMKDTIQERPDLLEELEQRVFHPEKVDETKEEKEKPNIDVDKE